MENPTRVLIVDDDDQICELLSTYLADFGIESQGVNGGVGMREAMRQTHFDAIILDLMLPGESGLSLCRQLRATTDIPIIMLTARGESTDRVVGLELGADDYMVKPFDPRELVARVHSILRRSRAERRPDQPPPAEQVSFEGWKLNRTLRQLTTPQQMLVPLSNAEFRLLWTFVERPRRILNRDQLMDAARGQLSTAFDRSIDLLVSRLRQKLGDDPKNPTLLKTVRGEGYLFDAEVVR
jgi:two-component system OmpR family response regulator